MELDFSKVCRVCLNEGIMMSIFKVNVSKKMMACSSVQVWQNDGLPGQICNKCLAKLHISFQFKKQCEKTDAKLRQYLLDPLKTKEQPALVQPQQEQMHQPQMQQQQQSQVQQPPQQHTMTFQTTHPQAPQNCVYIECAPLLDIQEQKFDGLNSISQPLTQLNYNVQSQNHLPITGYTLPALGQVQVYNGSYTMPVQQLPPTNELQNQVVVPPLQLLPQMQTITQQQPEEPCLHNGTNNVTCDPKDKIKRNVKIKREVKDNSVKQCSTCNKVFQTSTKLSRHMKTHSTDMPYKCKVCNKAFSHSGNFKIHLRMHTDERPFRCTVCDKGCRQAQDLEKHMRTHTGERPHQCTLCSKAFSTSSNLIAHIRTHTGEKPYVCCVCQKAFCQSNELTKHMRTHTGEKSHICDICHKGFNGSSTLIVHRRSHTGERPYVCQICSKGFAQSSCLVVHMKRHNGEKNFLCLSCNKSFVTNADLKEHSLIHSGDKPFGCNLCDKRYSRANDLNRHTKTHSV
ncbi:hypothetical protein PPYR_08172 [Photinus pyralis]|uniref:Protein krueppel n=1 Tax=Photinus pyralis TaxID=7054 RepID=A0A1Y1LMQ7_PHOPY|nr:zinc finger protein 2-like [Photinus pyralis]KAB0797178.1 hypothetical protein PPYR_08172 [Photinus pyralis]